MFHVDPTTKKITMHRGDTGEMTVTATGATFSTEDRVLFTVKDANGTEIIKDIFELTDGAFTKEFTNPETDYLTPGNYYWDARYVFNPEYDDSGNIIDGDGVSTPGSPFDLQILSTVGQI
jgi:hypothetical protein